MGEILFEGHVHAGRFEPKTFRVWAFDNLYEVTANVLFGEPPEDGPIKLSLQIPAVVVGGLICGN